MFTATERTTVRRIGGAVELHARVVSAARWHHVLHQEDVLLLVGRDPVRLRSRHRVLDVPPSVLTAVEPGGVVVLELPGVAQCRALYLPPGTLARAAGVPLEPRNEWASDRRLVWVIAGPSACGSADEMSSENDVERFLVRAAATLSRRLKPTSDGRGSHEQVSRARDLLLHGYARRITLDELSAAVGMRRFALAHAFTREIGMPPHAYQTHVRVQRARELIGDGHVLGSVWQEVGFADQSHLTRHFKRVVGLPPGRYGRAIARMAAPAVTSSSVVAPVTSVRTGARPPLASDLTLSATSTAARRHAVWNGHRA
jgi:AraC-like DNA-binding protein